MQQLLLLTVRFPYEFGEEFLETEINYLARFFDITIVPISAVKNYNIKRPIPENVTVDPDISKAIPRIASGTLLWFVRNPLLLGSLFHLIWKEKKQLRFNISRFKQSLRFAAQALIFADLIRKEFDKDQFEILYSYWLNQEALASVLLRQWGFTSIDIARAHGGDLYDFRQPTGYQPFQEKIVGNLDEIICISEHGSRYLAAKYPQHRAKMTVSRLGVRPAPTRNSPSQDNRVHLVSCAHLTPVKRIDLLIQALAQSRIPATWTHLGGGPQEDALRQQAKHLPENIHWRISGQMKNQDVLRFYQTHPVDLFINVSSSEGLPVSVMEAMSYGIPVAATDVGGTSELVENDRNGLLLPANITAAELTRALDDFFHKPAAEKNRMRENAWQTWQSLVNAEQQYPAFAEHLLTLTQQSARASGKLI